MHNSDLEQARRLLAGRANAIKETPFRLFVSLYKKDLLFRSLIDLFAVGLVVLTFTGQFGNPLRSIDTWVGSLIASETGSAISVPQGSTNLMTPRPPGAFNPLGLASYEQLTWFDIERTFVDRVSHDTRIVLDKARAFLSQGDLAKTREILSRHQEDPDIAYAYAVSLIKNAPGTPYTQIEDVLVQYRKATEFSVPEAFTDVGKLMMFLSIQYEKHPEFRGRPNALDGAGQFYEADAAELRRLARHWWERGNALGDPASARFLGLLEAMGLDGKPDMSAAIAFWRDATRRGDAFAPMDLAIIHLYGSDAAGEKDEAIANLELAITRGNWRAGAMLGVELVGRAKAGDESAAVRAIDNLKTVVDLALKKREIKGAVVSSNLLAQLLLEWAPSNLRNPSEAVKYLKISANNHDVDASIKMANFFERGLFVQQDRLRAYQYLWRVLPRISNGRKEAEALMETILSNMSKFEKLEAERLLSDWELQADKTTFWLPDHGYVVSKPCADCVERPR